MSDKETETVTAEVAKWFFDDYLLDARRLLADKPAPRDFFDRMLALYPDRLNPGPLWYGALGLLS